MKKLAVYFSVLNFLFAAATIATDVNVSTLTIDETWTINNQAQWNIVLNIVAQTHDQFSSLSFEILPMNDVIADIFEHGSPKIWQPLPMGQSSFGFTVKNISPTEKTNLLKKITEFNQKQKNKKITHLDVIAIREVDNDKNFAITVDISMLYNKLCDEIFILFNGAGLLDQAIYSGLKKIQARGKVGLKT